MSLRRVDKLVREEKYEQALKILLEVRASQPNNPYLPAYEERLRSAIEIRSRSAGQAIGEPGVAGGSASFAGEFPSVEEQLQAIARPVRPASDQKAEKRVLEQKKREDQRRVALLSKIASLIGSANEFLQKGEFDRALEEIARANMLDPGNGDISDLEERIRSAREEALRVAEEQRQSALHREEEERQERLRREREAAVREAEERRAREDGARRAAHEQKVLLCLRRSREFLGSGLLEEAQAELAFALVLQPDSKEASDLEGELGRRYEERRQAEIDRQREEEEERRQEEERIRVAVAAAVREAEEASRRGDFARALARITEAYIDDPGNATLVACENDILAARDEWARRQREEAQAAEEARRKAREEEERNRQDEERRRIREEREAQAREQRKQEDEQLWYHLRRARTLLSNGKHEQALAEVALAFVVNPFSDEVKGLEAEILLAQGAASLQGERPAASSSACNEDSSAPHAAAGEIRAILERATIHSTRKEFAQAFEEIAKAYALAPMDAMIAECEARIQAAFVKYQEELAPPRTPPHPGPAGSAARPAGAGSQRRGRRRVLQPSPSVHQPSLRAATSRSGRGSRALRLMMTAATLGAVSVTAVYLVNPGSTSAPTMPEATSTEGVTKQSPSPSPREVPPVVPREPGRGASREPEVLPRSGSSDQQSFAAMLSEAGFSPIPEFTTAREQQSKELEMPGETTRVQEEDLGLTRAATVEGSASTSPVDSIAQGPDDLYASSSLPSSPPSQAPQILRLSRPQLTDLSRRSETSEEITVMVEIGADGVPLQARVVRSTYPPYNHAVIDAVMRSEFRAGLTPSGPAAKWMTIPFRITP